MNAQLKTLPAIDSEHTALNPELHRLLQFCQMDRTWTRAKDVWLYDETGRPFLDCYSQYGAVALGHNAPCVTDAVIAALREEQPVMVQPFRAPYAVRLANALVNIAPGALTHCVFTNSGAETVECAIKLSRIASGRQIVLACDGSYHGKTLGAMAASDHGAFSALYGIPAPGFARVPFANIDALAQFLDAHGPDVAAFLLEPIQGEGGIRLPADGYLAAVRELCTRHGVALILDEIQTGLGRTGRLYCCEHEGVAPDILLTAKALGGGLFPLGACLSNDRYWDPRFALTHSSTFANNNVSSRVACAVLDTLNADYFCVQVARKGERLLSKLHSLAGRYPRIVRDVRGRGLLIAIELDPKGFDEGFFTSYLRHQNLTGYAFSAALAENESIIAVPTLGNANTLRIMPPLTIADEQIDLAVEGLERTLEAFTFRQTRTAVRALSGRVNTAPMTPASKVEVFLPPAHAQTSGAEVSSFAFMIHYTQRKDILTNDPTLSSFDEKEMDHYCNYIADMPPGVVCEIDNLQSACGARTHGWLIALGMLPEEMYRRGSAKVAAAVTRGVDLAAELGAEIVGLGAFTSIFTRQGMAVLGRGPKITTGNTLTSAMAHKAILHACEQQGLSIQDARVGIVGARGSVASLCAQLLARSSPRSMTLIGRPEATNKNLQDIATRLRFYTRCPIDISTDLAEVRDCDIVLSATSSRLPVLDTVPLRSGTIVCDVARPQDAGEVTRSRSDLVVVDGGLVSLPDPTVRFGVGNIQGFPAGVQLACLAETMLLALAREKRDFGIGDTATLEDVDYLCQLADRHGFGLAVAARDSGRPWPNRSERPEYPLVRGAPA